MRSAIEAAPAMPGGTDYQGVWVLVKDPDSAVPEQGSC